MKKFYKILFLELIFCLLIIKVSASEEYFNVRRYNSNIENKYLDLIDANTKLSDYLQKFTPNNEYSINVDLEDKQYIFTGSKLSIYKSGTLVDQLTNIVRGDINGDGKISSIDYVKIKNHIMEKNIISDSIFLSAADIDFDSKISSRDYVRIRNIVMGAKKFTIELNSNGAILENNSISCVTSGSECEITLPEISTDGTVIGWSTNPNSTTSNYSVNQKIKLTKDMTLYAITKKTFTATFDKNAATSLSYTTKSCDAYNGDTSCTVKTPTIIVQL